MPTQMEDFSSGKRSLLSSTSTPPRGKRVDLKTTPNRQENADLEIVAPRSISPLISLFPSNDAASQLYSKCINCYDKLVMSMSQFNGHVIQPLCLYIDGIDQGSCHDVLEEVIGFGDSLLTKCVLTDQRNVNKVHNIVPGTGNSYQNAIVLTQMNFQTSCPL